MKNKVAFITSIMGNYEATCKPFAKQSIDSDFICFTDNNDIPSNGWTIDTTPYFDLYPSEVDTGYYINSITKKPPLTEFWKGNRHSFNLAKYYKQSWHNIPRLQEYDLVIWIDGSIEITSSEVAEYMLEKCKDYKIVSWQHEWRAGRLVWEAHASYLPRYHDTNYLNQSQPYQDVAGQYHNYLSEGYDETFWERYPRKEGRGRGNHFGVWTTGFVSFLNNSEEVKNFLDLWYLQTLQYTTQDQVGFPKVAQDTKLVPYTLPDSRFTGDDAHGETSIFKVHKHGT